MSLAQVLSLIPSIHVGHLTIACNSSSRWLDTFGLQEHFFVRIHIHFEIIMKRNGKTLNDKFQKQLGNISPFLSNFPDLKNLIQEKITKISAVRLFALNCIMESFDYGTNWKMCNEAHAVRPRFCHCYVTVFLYYCSQSPCHPM